MTENNLIQEENFAKACLVLSTRFGYSPKDLIKLLSRKAVFVPASIFSQEYSPLSALVIYLYEEEGLPFQKISEKIGRSYASVWDAYRRKKLARKEPKRAGDGILIPLSCFRKGLSITECVVSCLTDVYGMSLKEVSESLGMSPKTVWTIKKRASKKNASEAMAD